MKIYNEDFIYQLLQDKRRISYKELSDICKLSLPTIRKITATLEQQGLVSLIYGGVELVSNSDNVQELTSLLRDQKAIAQQAVALINDGEAIFLGPGKTVATMCDYLQEFTNLTVFTNSVYVIEKLSKISSINLIIIGGILQRINMGFSLYDDDNSLPDINISKLFIGGSGVDPIRGIFHSMPVNKATEEMLVSKSKSVILLVDKRKFGVEKAFVAMPMSKINMVISTKDLDEKYINQLNEHSIPFILAEPT